MPSAIVLSQYYGHRSVSSLPPVRAFILIAHRAQHFHFPAFSSDFAGWCSVTIFKAVSDGAVLPLAGSFADGSPYFLI